MKKNGIISNSFIWLGAGLSIAEILTGTYFAPLGFKKGIIAIILGHIIGAVLMFFAGLIGAKSRKNAMQSTSITFANGGAKIFSSLNIVQLVGWTAIMIYDGALAANRLFPFGRGVWSLIIGALVIIWLLVSKNELNVINTIAISALAILSIFICTKIFANSIAQIQLSNDAQGTTLSFAQALELSIAMPLSWLPLISDYTHTSEKPFAATLASVVVYTIVSIWMYIVGMSMSIFTGEQDISATIARFGGVMSIAGLYVIVFSTVTTTYLDAYSAGISSLSISKKINAKMFSVLTVALASGLAIIFNMDNITNFLYFIGSVFAPMIAVQIADYFVLKSRDEQVGFCWRNLFIWLLGFEIYRFMMRQDTILSSTIPAMIISFVATLAIKFIEDKFFVDKRSLKL